MSEEWWNFEARWDLACWKNMAFRDMGKRVITLVPCRFIMYVHNSSTCVCVCTGCIHFIIYDFWVHSKLTLLLLLFPAKKLTLFGIFKVAFIPPAPHHFSLNFLALLFCPDCHFTTEQEINPLTASLFLHWNRKWTKLILTLTVIPLPSHNPPW